MRNVLVVTSISGPSEVLHALAAGANAAGWGFILIGDRKSPPEFRLDNCRFFSLEQQKALEFESARLMPVGHYARKNLGYLIALREGAETILETDDDNWPGQKFFDPKPLHCAASVVDAAGWVNVYRYFTDVLIWPRGLPLDEIHSTPPAARLQSSVVCPIQQGLADDNPDVDAVYRLV